MSDLDDIAAALAHQIDSIEGIAGVAEWPDHVNPPLAIVYGPTDGTYETVFGGEAAEYRFDIDVIVDISALRGFAQAQQDLRPFLSRRGPQSIPATLYAAGRLGGLIDALWVERFTMNGQMEIDDSQNHFAATISCRVRTPC